MQRSEMCLLPCHWVPLTSPGSISPTPSTGYLVTLSQLSCRLSHPSSLPLLPAQTLQGKARSLTVNLISTWVFPAGWVIHGPSLSSHKACTPTGQQHGLAPLLFLQSWLTGDTDLAPLWISTQFHPLHACGEGKWGCFMNRFFSIIIQLFWAQKDLFSVSVFMHCCSKVGSGGQVAQKTPVSSPV